MSGTEFRFQEISTVKDGMLDSKVASLNDESLSAKLAREGELLKDGLSGGFSARLQHAKENVTETLAEVGVGAGLGAALTYGLKAGGKWGAAAKVAGSVFMLGMAADVTRRAIPTLGAMGDTWNSSTNLDQNKQIVGHYAGTALFDYPLMFASGAAGAGAVHFGPRALKSFNERPSLLEPQMNMQPQFAFAEQGRLGAKEIADPLAAIRGKMEMANPKKAFGLGELNQAMEVRRLATHEGTKPMWDQMAEGLTKVDAMKPQVLADQAQVRTLEKQIADLSAARPEMKAVTEARQKLDGLGREGERLAGFEAEAAQIRQQLKDSKPAKDAPADAKPKGKGKDEAPAVNREELKGKLDELNGTIRGIKERQGQRQQYEQNLATAEQALAARQQAIAEGTAADIAGLKTELTTTQTRLAASEAELASLTTRMNELNASFDAKAVELRPTLDQGGIVSTADIVLPKKPVVEVAPRPVTPKPAKVERAQAPVERAPVQAEKPAATDNRGGGRRHEDAGHRGDRRPQQQERRVEETKPQEKVVGAEQVSKSLTEANKAVDDFVATRKRHTTALKAVENYIATTFEAMARDPKMSEQSGAVLKNVEGMLGKMDNWQRGASWFRREELGQIKGVTPEQMGRYNEWFDSVKGNYIPKGGMPEMQLMGIQQHLQNRVAVESVKHWMRTGPETQSQISPVVNKGFELMRDGKLPDGKPIPEGSSMIVLVERSTPEGNLIAPFAKDGKHMQWFDGDKIAAGMQKQDLMINQGPKAMAPEQLYGFRLDHDPSRLIGSLGQQRGFAILRPGGQWGKNVAYYELAPGVEPTLLPKNFRMDGQNGAGTNTGVLFNLLRNLSTPPKPKG